MTIAVLNAIRTKRAVTAMNATNAAVSPRAAQIESTKESRKK
jgi:hypothetical protein